jgi:hypothetical protein
VPDLTPFHAEGSSTRLRTCKHLPCNMGCRLAFRNWSGKVQEDAATTPHPCDPRSIQPPRSVNERSRVVLYMYSM